MNVETWEKEFHRLVSAYPIGKLTEEVGAAWYQEISRNSDKVIHGAVTMMMENVKIPTLQRLIECIYAVRKKTGGEDGHIKAIMDYAHSLSKDMGIQAQIVINKKWGWAWGDIPRDSTEEVKEYLHSVHTSGTLLEIVNPKLAERMAKFDRGELEMTPETKRFVAMNAGVRYDQEDRFDADW